jgi:gas vesicle protein
MKNNFMFGFAVGGVVGLAIALTVVFAHDAITLIRFLAR